MKVREAMTVAIQHHQSGRLPQAEALYRQVLEMTPNHPDALHLLGVVELQNGNPDAGAELIHQAICHDQDNADYQANFGMALWELGRQDEAVSAYERALHLNPSHANAHYSLGNAHRARGRLAEAIASLRHSVRLELGAVEVRANLAALLLENDNAAAALEECDACLDRQPNSRLALSYKALALQSLGKRQPARYLLDLERLVIAQTIEIPAELGSLPEFNAALARHILVHPTLSEAQTGKATRYGLQTGELLAEPKGPFAALEVILNSEVRAYLSSIPQDGDHPYLAVRPPRWNLVVWAVVLDSRGHQTAHMHADGWVSGVYYVRLPAVMSEQPPAGWIEFGRPPSELGSKLDPEVRSIRPQEGRLVLFPSYFFHQTIPFESDEPRISVAFDAVPVWG